MKINRIETKEILDFEKEIGCELVVNERERRSLGPWRWYARFEKGDVKGEGVLIGSAGNGDTIDEALRGYCNQISGKTLVFNANTLLRREIKCPRIVHTRDAEKEYNTAFFDTIIKERRNKEPNAEPIRASTYTRYELWIETHKHHPLFALQLKPEVKLWFKGEEVTMDKLTEILERK